jgi:hypothetical protein
MECTNFIIECLASILEHRLTFPIIYRTNRKNNKWLYIQSMSIKKIDRKFM